MKLFLLFVITLLAPVCRARRCRNEDMIVGECMLRSACESQYYETTHCAGSEYCCLPAPSCGSNGGRCRRSSTCTGTKRTGLCGGNSPSDVVCCENENPVIPADASRLLPIMPDYPPAAPATLPGDAWLRGPKIGGFGFDRKDRSTSTWRAKSGSPGTYSVPVNKILLHTVEGRWPKYGDYEAGTNTLDGGFWSHFLVAANFDGEVRIIQYLPMDKPSFSLKYGQRSDVDGVIQIEIGGTAYKEFTTYDPILTEAVRALVQEIRRAFPAIQNQLAPGVVFAPCYTCAAGFSASQRYQDRATWQAANGILGHQHAWNNDHWDPGPIDPQPLFCLEPWCGATPPDGSPGASRAPTPQPTPQPTVADGGGDPTTGSNDQCFIKNNACLTTITLNKQEHNGHGAWRIAIDHDTSLQDFYLFNPGTEANGVFLGKSYNVRCPDGEDGCKTVQVTPPPTFAPTRVAEAPDNCLVLDGEFCVTKITLDSGDNGKGPYTVAADHATPLPRFYQYNPKTATEGVFVGQSYFVNCPVANACDNLYDKDTPAPSAAPTDRPTSQGFWWNNCAPGDLYCQNVYKNGGLSDADDVNQDPLATLPDWLWPVVGVSIFLVLVVSVVLVMAVRYVLLRRQATASASPRHSAASSRRRSARRGYSQRASSRANLGASSRGNLHRKESMFNMRTMGVGGDAPHDWHRLGR